WARYRVEVVRGGGDVGNAQIAIGAERQGPRGPGARVLRPLALVAVRQEECEPGGLPPLGETGDEELIDDHLAAIREVAVLRLPQHQRVGRGGGVAVLEPQARELGERTVVQLERRPRARKVLNRGVAA